MNLKFFKISEFDSPDEKGSGCNMKEDFLMNLDIAREVAGTPFIITSGYRSPSHNKKVGGVKNSSHTKGYACDIRVDNSLQRHKILVALMSVGFARIGIAVTYIHVDMDENKTQDVIWVY